MARNVKGSAATKSKEIYLQPALHYAIIQQYANEGNSH